MSMDRQNTATVRPGTLSRPTQAAERSVGRTPPDAHPSEGLPAGADRLHLAVVATFTADLIEPPLAFWMERLAIPAAVTLAPYGQVMQELLNPQSSMSGNRDGFNVLLIRLEDWIRDRLATHDIAENLEHVQRATRELEGAIKAMRARTSTPALVFFCPASHALPEALQERLESLQHDLAARLWEIPHVHCWTHGTLAQLYPVDQHEDARADRLGHIPYTQDYFVAMATLVARRVAALVKPAYKVIAVDCDNTLWRNACKAKNDSVKSS
jgi:predicted enzyme involved in methoxymalonyl-ACP biosynthesis